MNTNLFIPKRINVGFQKRSSTYTGKLAYIIYYDNNGVLRKETSWNSWRDYSIPNEEFDNVPTEGFVLNKKAGGYSSGWNHRQTYCRIYDPRGFEFEITIDNLLYILEHCNCIKGKGIEGKLIYSWNGTELVLLPVDSHDYQEIVNYNNLLDNPEVITNSTLVPGYTYLTAKNKELLYLGKYDYYDSYGKSEGKKYVFADFNRYSDRLFGMESFKSINKKFIKIVSDVVPSEFSNYLDILEESKHISPIDESKSEYIKLDFETFDKFLKFIKGPSHYSYYFSYKDNMIRLSWIMPKNHTINVDMNTLMKVVYESPDDEELAISLEKEFKNGITIKNLYDKFDFYLKKMYLENGTFYCTSKDSNYW